MLLTAVLLCVCCMRTHLCALNAGIHAEDFTPAQMCELPLDNYPELKPVPAWEASNSYNFMFRTVSWRVTLHTLAAAQQSTTACHTLRVHQCRARCSMHCSSYRLCYLFTVVQRAWHCHYCRLSIAMYTADTTADTAADTATDTTAITMRILPLVHT